MLIAGFGKLAQMVVSLNNKKKEFFIYNRTSEKVENARERDNRLFYTGPEQFGNFQSVFLALPPEASLTFIRHYSSRFPDNCTIYYTATNLMINDVKKTDSPHRLVPVKFAGHARQAMREKSGGTFVVPEEYGVEKERLAAWLGDSFSVVDGAEEVVKLANQAAVEETIKSAVQLLNRLEELEVGKHVQEAVLTQIPAGVLHAHLREEHGAFAKQVLKKVKESKGVKNHEDR